MNPAVVVLLITGLFLIMHGIYREKLDAAEKRVQVEYRFVPRSYYEEQLFDSQFRSKLAPVFEEDDQWYARNIGKEMAVDRRRL